MKLTVPSATIFAMAFYSSSAAAFSMSKQHLGRNVVSNAAKIFGATYLSAQAPVSVFAAKGAFPNGKRAFSKSTSTALNMADEKKEAPFKTWTFDNACDEMEFNELSEATISITDDLSQLDDSDLVMFGIYGAEEKEDEENDKDDDDAVPEPALVGEAKTIDEMFEGALTDLLMENYKAFKHGGSVGAVTPVLRIFSGEKVSYEL